MTDVAAFLSGLPFFSKLSRDELVEVATYIHTRTFRRGEVILLQGEVTQAVYFIVRGQVGIYRISAEGREQMLKRLGPGSAFNLVPALTGSPNPSTAMARTVVTAYSLEPTRFLWMIRAYPAVAEAILVNFADKLRHMTSLVEDLSLRTVGARLAKLLLSQAANAQEIPRRMTLQEMAAQLGTVREVIGRALADLEREGLIHVERHRIVIINRPGLEAKAMLQH